MKTNDYKISSDPSIKLENVYSSWTNEPDSYCLEKINIDIQKNELLAVVGSVGSGKTSLLMTLLGEMKSIKGNLKVEGSVFYVQQEPWIFSASLRQNILFGKPYVKEKFDEIIKACCLEEDMKLFSNGEDTVIGEKGINLSGGQRARVGLARALYSDAQIFLLDDPLSAVDANVAKHLFNECFNKYMNDKIRILITHQIHYLTEAGKILLLENGKIKAQGSYDELIKLGIDMNQMFDQLENEHEIKRNNTVIDKNDTSVVKNHTISATESVSSNNELEITPMITSNKTIDTSPEIYASKKEINADEFKEKVTLGKLAWKNYFLFFKTGGGVFGTLIFFLVMISSQVVLTFSDYWVNHWAEQERSDYYQQINDYEKWCFETKNTTWYFNCTSSFGVPVYKYRDYYYFIYLGLVLTSIFSVSLRYLFFYTICLRASKKLHKKMFKSVMTSHSRFFDLNPLGRIINRFSKDIGLLDEQIPWAVLDFIEVALMVSSSVVITLLINPWIMIPLFPLIFLFIYIRNYYLKASIEVKRIDGINRSPIYIHVNNTVSGILAIRACKNEKKLYEEFNDHTDFHTRATIGYAYLTRWFAVRLDWIAALFTVIAVYGCIFLKDNLAIKPGQIGVMLVYLFHMLPIFQWCLRQSCEVENLMTSVERILEYTVLDPEPIDEGKIKPQENWPQKGQIKFDNVCFSYAKNLPYVLNDLSFEIQPKEKIGVVGRTGAGKSSIIQALYRMAEPDGSIQIDNVDIKDISLHDLRKKLSIIPQEPTIFIGTIRTNLDPFNEHTDQEIWDALDKVQLKESIQDMDGKLEADIQKGGSNLSVGQKQLICLARAIIKKSKILIIDEATANVDFKTDSLIQSSIRDAFTDCTVITIAHRLQTIIDNDKIMCMDKGKLIDYGKPIDLLNDKNTILHDLVYSLEKSERLNLIKMAKLADIKNRKNLNSTPINQDDNDESFVENSLVENEDYAVLFSDEEKESFLSKKA